MMKEWDEGPAFPFTGMEDFEQNRPAPQRRFQRRSSCSALPSTTIMELNDVAIREPRDGVPLGSFLRFNNSFSDSVTSISDNSECAMSGDNSGLAVENTECAKFDVEAFSEMTGIEFCPDGLGGDAEGAAMDKKKKKKKKKQSKESDVEGEKPSRRRMQRRSSWSASTTMHEPVAAVDGVVVRERRHRSSRKPIVESFPLPDHENDGVITSFKSTNCNEVMFEERSSSTSDRNIVISEEKVDVNEDHDATATNAVPNSEIPTTDNSEPPRPRGRVNRRASWSGGGCYEQPPNPVDIRSTDVVKEDNSRIVSPSGHDLGRNDVVRTLLMVKHVQSGASKARRRVSWTASTVNCLDEPPRSPVDSPQDLVADVFAYLKKTANDTVDDEDSVAEEQQDVPPVHEVATTTVIQDDSTTESSSRQMERRTSWHASSSSQPESSVNSNTSQRSSQTFVLDLSDPSRTWTCSEEFQDTNDGQQVPQTQQQQQQHQGGRKTSTRPWKLGKSRNQSDGVGTPDIVVVSSANMPVHDWRSQTYDVSCSCLQLTAFGDVTTIGCE